MLYMWGIRHSALQASPRCFHSRVINRTTTSASTCRGRRFSSECQYRPPGCSPWTYCSPVHLCAATHAGCKWFGSTVSFWTLISCFRLRWGSEVKLQPFILRNVVTFLTGGLLLGQNHLESPGRAGTWMLSFFSREEIKHPWSLLNLLFMPVLMIVQDFLKFFFIFVNINTTTFHWLDLFFCVYYQ